MICNCSDICDQCQPVFDEDQIKELNFLSNKFFKNLDIEIITTISNIYFININ